MIDVTSFAPIPVWLLKSDQPNYDKSNRLATTLGLNLPACINIKCPGEPAVLSLAPGEWLLRYSSSPDSKVFLRWQRDVGAEVSLFDLSHAYVGCEVTGSGALSLLSCLISPDLRESEFGPGSCMRTPLREVSVILHRLDGNQSFELLVERSYAVYIAEWLNFQVPLLD